MSDARAAVKALHRAPTPGYFALVMSLAPGDQVLATLIAAIAATVQGSVGFGSALIAAPLLALIDPRFVPGPIILANLALTLAVTLRERRAVDLRGAGLILAGRVPGTLAAVVCLDLAPRELFPWLFSGLILAAVGLSIGGFRLEPRPPAQLMVGLVSGLMGTITSVGGPPVALLYQHHRGSALRGTLSGYFVLSTSMSIAALALFGLLGLPELIAAAGLLPGFALGFLLSNRTRHALDRRGTRPLVLGLSASAAIMLLAKQL